MSSRQFFLLIAFVSLVSVCNLARAQENLAADPNAPLPPPPGVDKYYWDLSQLKDPKDRALKSMAERYVNLVKVQEWSDLSGKFRTVARYVKHDPNFTTVTIESVKGRGAERTTKEVTVPVDKLSKTCQSRVRQIDTMQKKIKEMAKAKPGENGAVPGAPGETPGGPIVGAPGPEGGPAEPMPPTPAAPEPDPSASEPDPLGFGEIPATPAADVAPPSPVPMPESTPTPPADSNSSAVPTAPNKAWQTDIEAFRSIFKVYPVGPAGQQDPPKDRKLVHVSFHNTDGTESNWEIDFGELDDLRLEAEALSLADGDVRRKISKAEFQQTIKNAQDAEKRVSEVVWEATFKGFYRPTQPIALQLPPLPEPFSYLCMLDTKSGATPDAWSGLARGDRIRFKARLSMAGPTMVKLSVREPEKIAASTETQH